MAPTVLLSCDDLTHAYGGRPLFRGLSLAVHEGDRIGLVGPNGAGKSTLLRILCGTEAPDEGRRTVRKLVRVGMVPQDPVFARGRSARQVVRGALDDVPGLDDAQRDQAAALALGKAGFADAEQGVEVLSGGWRKRLAIAVELARQPDVLLMDEPTNHLDLEGILWLEQLLAAEARAFVVVSHDRAFLQAGARRMLELNPTYENGLFDVAGNYADFLEARDAWMARRAADSDRLANRVRQEVAWLRRGPKARTRKSKARLDAAADSIDALAERRTREATRTTTIDFDASGRKTKRLLVAEGVGVAFDGRPIVRDLDLVLSPGSRLGVLGGNGSGKTTLLRLLVGTLEPRSGTLSRAEGLAVAYFDQNRERLDPESTLRRALAPHGDSVVVRGQSIHVVSWARRFLFSAEQLDMPLGTLSGGERARVHIARLMQQPADLLVLDEPTNDLDIPTLGILEEALTEFDGALVLVTHDRFLLDRVTDGVLAPDGEGRWPRYADYRQWEAEHRDREREQAAESKPKPAPKKQPARKRLSYLEQREWDAIEGKLLHAEERAAEAKARAEDPSIATDAAELQRRHRELNAAQAEVDGLYARWAELEAKLAD